MERKSSLLFLLRYSRFTVARWATNCKICTVGNSTNRSRWKCTSMIYRLQTLSPSHLLSLLRLFLYICTVSRWMWVCMVLERKSSVSQTASVHLTPDCFTWMYPCCDLRRPPSLRLWFPAGVEDLKLYFSSYSRQTDCWSDHSQLQSCITEAPLGCLDETAAYRLVLTAYVLLRVCYLECTIKNKPLAQLSKVLNQCKCWPNRPAFSINHYGILQKYYRKQG